MTDEAIKIGDEEVSLTDIAGVEMDEVKEHRFQVTPQGIYQWNVKDAKLEAINNKPVIRYILTATNVLSLTDDALRPEDFINVEHNEVIFITDLAKDLGRAKAFMVDTGFTGSGTLQELLDQFVGHGFIGVIKHRKDKNDADITYANINMQKLKSLEEAA